jgi:uncharacterized membrane protein YeaQ/YmgE (transglycosylase-associated protein family)
VLARPRWLSQKAAIGSRRFTEGERRSMVVQIAPLHSGLLKTIFIDTWLSFAILGQPAGGFKLTLIDIIILVLIAYLVSFISEKLTGQKLGGTMKATIITLIGAWLMIAFVRLPWDFQIEDVRIIAALLGAIIVGVFYTLIRAQLQKKK